MRQRPVVIPPGLKVVVEGLSKAVVRYQPTNIADFASIFFNSLVDFRAEKPGLSVDELVKEFKATVGSHFFKMKTETIIDDPVHGSETIPHTKPVQELEAGALMMEAKYDVGDRLENSSDQSTMSADGKQNDRGGCVSGTTISLYPSYISQEMAHTLALYRRKINPEDSPQNSMSREHLDPDTTCPQVRNTIFERVSISQLKSRVNAVVIRTGVLPIASQIFVQTEDNIGLIIFQADASLAEKKVAAPCCNVEDVEKPLPLHPVTTTDDMAHVMTTTETHETPPLPAQKTGGNTGVPEQLILHTEPSDYPSPPASTTMASNREPNSACLTSPPAATTELTESTHLPCSHHAPAVKMDSTSTVPTDETSPVHVILKAMSPPGAIKMADPPSATSMESPSAQSEPAPISEETRTPYLLYLPLPIELARTPSLMCQLGLGPEEAKGLSFVYLPVTPAELPLTPSSGLPPAMSQEIPQTYSYLLANNKRMRGLPSTPSFWANPVPYSKMPHISSLVHTSATMAQETRGSCMLGLHPNAQGGTGTSEARFNQSTVQEPVCHSQACRAMLNNELHSESINHRCSHRPSQQSSVDMMTSVAGIGQKCLCTILSRTGSHWQLCHLSHPESLSKMDCPNNTSKGMLHCGHDHMTSLPMYQDCKQCYILHQLLNCKTPHGRQCSHMAEPLCPACTMGPFAQPQAGHLDHLDLHCTAQPHDRPGMCPLQCTLMHQRQSFRHLCDSHRGLLQMGSSDQLLANTHRELKQKDSIPPSGLVTGSTNQESTMNCCPEGN